MFFNAASWGILPLSTVTEVADLTLRRNRTHGFEEAELGRIQRRCRSAIASLLKTDPQAIALAPNTSFGVNLAAALLRRGDPGVVLSTEGEFPANILPFKALESEGFELRLVPSDPTAFPDEERLLEAVGAPGVRALTISAVQFASGYRADLRRLGQECRSQGVLFFVDAIQQVGAAPFYPDEVFADLVACGGQKWLCAPWGSGFVWIRPEVQSRFDPPMVSWLATMGGADFEDMLHYRMDWRPNARKFDLGLARSVEVLLELGVVNVEEHIGRVQEPLVRWLQRRADTGAMTPLDRHRRAGIFSFRPSDLDATVQALTAERVVFSVREGAIRFAPHFYNTVGEMEAVVELIDEVG